MLSDGDAKVVRSYEMETLEGADEEMLRYIT